MTRCDQPSIRNLKTTVAALLVALLAGVLLALAPLAPSNAYAAQSDLQFVSYSGASVTSSGTNPSDYTVYVRDGDTVYVTLKVKNNSGKDLEFVTMSDTPSYVEGDNGLEPIAYGEDEEAFLPITFPPYRGVDTLVTDADNMSQKWLTSETTGVGYPGYWIENGASPTFKLKINAGDLAPGTYNWNLQLGRLRWDYEKHLIVVDPTLSYEQWDYMGETVEEAYSAKIPIKVVVYTQNGASLRVGEGTAVNPVQTELTSDGIDFGTIDLATASDDQLTGSYTVNAINSGTPNVFTDSHGNPTSIKVAFTGENNGNAVQAWDGAAFNMSNGTLYDINWSPLEPGGNGTQPQTASYTVSYDVETLIAGTYTGNLIVNTIPHKVSVNGQAGNNTGVYKYPVKIVLTGTNPRLLPKATNLTATPGNGRVDLTWTPGEGAGEYTEYTIWRREGVETESDPDKLDWSLYEEVGTKAVGDPNDDGTILFVDANVENGTTYSYTVIYGRPYHGYAANTASSTPDESIQSPMLAPDISAGGVLNGVEVSWEMHENYGGSNSDGAGMVDHFNIYRDGVLIDQISRSAVSDEVSYGWREEVPGSGTYTYGITGHSYSWVVEEPVPELYTNYNFAVSAVSPSGVESDLSEASPAEAYGETPVILSHNAWFEEDYYNGDTGDYEPAIMLDIDTYGDGDSVETLTAWRAEGTNAPSTDAAPYATFPKDYTYSSDRHDYEDFGVSPGKTYTYTVQGTDYDGNLTNFYTFTVKAVEDVNFGTVKTPSGYPAFSVVDNGKKARLQWTSDYYYDDYDVVYTGTYKVYRDDTLIATLSPDDSEGSFDYRDDPGSDGVYTYRVDKVVEGVTVRGRDYVFHRNTQPVDPASLLQVPGAPTLTGRTSGGSNIILSWTPSDEGGTPEGYHIYRTDSSSAEGDRVQMGGRYVSTWHWYGYDENYESWGNGRYISLAGGDTLTFVDGRTNDHANNDYYHNDTHQGRIENITWYEYDSETESNVPLSHQYYITAYNRAGESAPSPLVVLSPTDVDQWGDPVAPENEADEAPSTPAIDDVWVDWEEYSSQNSGFDSVVGGYVRVAWNDAAIGADIDQWELTYTGLGGYNDSDTETLNAALALADPATKLGTSQDAPGCSVGAQADGGQVGRTITVSVAAQNSAGATVSQPATYEVLSFPRSYVMPDNGGALIRWTDLFGGTEAEVTGWEVWRKAEYGIWEKAITLPGTLEYAGEGKDDYNHPVNYYEWADTGLDNGWTYQYKVVAKCADGVDRPGQVREVTPKWSASTEAPGAPQNLTYEIVGGEVVFHWDEPATGGSPQEYYMNYLDKRSYNDYYDWNSGGSADAPSTSMVWRPDKPGTYPCIVRSSSYIDGNDVPRCPGPWEIDHDGWTSWQVEENLAHLDELYPSHSGVVYVTVTQEDIDARATEGPGEFTLSGASDAGQVQLSWTESAGATSYEIERWFKSTGYQDSEFGTVTVSPTTRTYVDVTAEPGVSYCYRVLAKNNAGTNYKEVAVKVVGVSRDEIAAQRVSALIETLPGPDTVGLTDAERVYEVKDLYDSLTAKQKSLIDDELEQKLLDDIQALEDLEAMEEYREQIDAVQAQIDALSDILTLDDEPQVNAARAALNALPTNAQRLVNASKLVSAEETIAALKKAAADEEAAAPVRAMIEELPEFYDVTLDDEEAVAAALDAFDALTADQKGLISDELQIKLSNCVAKIAELHKAAEDLAAAQPVMDAIADLPEPSALTLDDADGVAAAREAYDALTDDQKAFVNAADDTCNTAKLEADEARLAELKTEADQAAAQAVQDLIDALPDAADVTLDDADAIEDAREAYDALTNDQKALVDDSKLTAAEEQLEKLATPHIRYRTGVEGNTTWQGWKRDGELSGTVGQSLRMEGLKIELEDAPYPGGIEYKSQLQSDGWEKEWKRDGETSGYDPQKTGGKRLEAVQIQLYGEMAEHYDVWYHLQVQRFGWMAWAKNGESSGTVGYAFRVEALEIVLMPKGSEAPTIGSKVASDQINMLSFVRCRSYDNKVWQGAKGEGDVSGTRGQKKTQIRVGLASSSLTAAGIDRGDSFIQVSVYQDGKWTKWSTEDDQYMGNPKGGAITGVQARIKPGTTLASQYDLYYRAEVRESSKACWLGWAKNGQTAGQKNLNLEQLEFSLVEKGDPAPPANVGELQGTIAHIKQTWVIERWPCNYPKANYRF